RLLKSGVAEDLLVKPLSRQEVMEQIERLLEGRLRGATAAKIALGAGGRALPSFVGVKVLAADDSAVNREVVKEALTRLGAIATVVDDGRAAVEAVLAQSFDLILMDRSMPEMDGFEATRAIRNYEQETGARR